VCTKALYCVKAILVLDQEGGRLCARYFTDDWGPLDKQLAFEKQLHKKAQPHGMHHLLCTTSTSNQPGDELARCERGDNDSLYLLVLPPTTRDQPKSSRWITT